jgi:hypothetical protein
MARATREIRVAVAATVQVVRRIVVAVESAIAPTRVAPGDPGGCCPVDPPDAVFQKVTVYNRVTGGARVTWELVDDFQEEGPYEVRLQVSPSGVPDAADWVEAGVPAVDPAYLVDPRQRTYGMAEVVHYRVVLVSAVGTHVSRPALPRSVLGVRDYLLVQEMTRKLQLELATGTGTTGFLLKAKRYGITCSCVHPVTRERQNSACPVCYGTGKIGGFHPPLACTLSELPPYETRQMTAYAEARGSVGDEVFAAGLSPGVPIVQEDVWVNEGDDARYYIHKVWNRALHRGVVIQQAAEFRRAPRSDVIYRFPVDASPGAGCEWGLSDADRAAEAVCLTQSSC